MPQLDPSSFASQLFWLTVSFILLYVLLARMLLPRVQSVLALREGTIAEDLEQAKRMKADADMAREQYEKALAHARNRSQGLLAETQADIAARAHKRHLELDADIEQKMLASQSSIAAALKDVKGKLTSVAAELTAAISEAVIHHMPDAKAVDQAVAGIVSAKEA